VSSKQPPSRLSDRGTLHPPGAGPPALQLGQGDENPVVVTESLRISPELVALPHLVTVGLIDVTVNELRRLFHALILDPGRRVADVIAWSIYRRRHQRRS
jgi:hypothetical protein